MIRRLGLEDRSAFRALRQLALDSNPESYATSGEDWRNAPDEKIDVLLRGSVEGRLPTFGYFVPELVGMVGLRLEEEPTMRHKASIWGLFVSSEWQNQGVGRSLMDFAIHEARATAGIEMLTLVVTTNRTPALRLFDRCGFQEYGTEPRARQIDGVYFDQVYMYQFLKEESVK